MRSLTRIGPEPLRESELSDFVGTPESGGVVLFAGVVRNHHEGRSVLRIDYEAAAELASAQLRRIAEEALARPGVHRVAAVHRTGRVEVGEASVLVAASAAHRAEAFETARFLIDRIKELLPVWKREYFADGTDEWAPGFTVADADRSPGAQPEESA